MKPNQSPIARREFIKRSSLALGGTMLLWSGCKQHKPTAHWQYLTEEEAQIIIAMSSRIIPSDDAPGAVEAGVVYFIDQQLVSYYRRWTLVYREGLKGVEKASETLFSKPFTDLDPQKMDALLEQIEDESIPTELNPGKMLTRFFNLLVDHCMQGFYGDPRHGGNRDWGSYQMLDLRVIDPDTVKLS